MGLLPLQLSGQAVDSSRLPAPAAAAVTEAATGAKLRWGRGRFRIPDLGPGHPLLPHHPCTWLNMQCHQRDPATTHAPPENHCARPQGRVVFTLEEGFSPSPLEMQMCLQDRALYASHVRDELVRHLTKCLEGATGQTTLWKEEQRGTVYLVGGAVTPPRQSVSRAEATVAWRKAEQGRSRECPGQRRDTRTMSAPLTIPASSSDPLGKPTKGKTESDQSHFPWVTFCDLRINLPEVPSPIFTALQSWTKLLNS